MTERQRSRSPASANGNSSHDARWARHQDAWRNPAQVAALWEHADGLEPGALDVRVTGPFWELLEALDVTLLATREYEHLAVALTVADGHPRTSFLRLPHPSGLVADRASGRVHIASTRNPNQVVELAPAVGAVTRGDARPPDVSGGPLVPLASRFYPGSLYVHDLALVGGALHANAVGENTVVRLADAGRYERVWWPQAIEVDGSPDFSRNYLQLNSIAPGADIAGSFFTASSDRISTRRPGHRNFPVDGRGVLFSGATREPVVGGLTRPHSARLHDGRLWLGNSGYGEVGVVSDGRFEAVARLEDWTRGLTFCGDVAFVGGSRVIPRFRQYAPGLDVDRGACRITVLDVRSGATLATLEWPNGNQLFALDWLPRTRSLGFPFAVGRDSWSDPKDLFYAFRTSTNGDGNHHD